MYKSNMLWDQHYDGIYWASAVKRPLERDFFICRTRDLNTMAVITGARPIYMRFSTFYSFIFWGVIFYFPRGLYLPNIGRMCFYDVSM